RESFADGREERLARSKRIERAGLDQAFEDAFIQKTRFDALAEIVERLELALRQPRFANRLGRVFANVLDRRETKPNGFTHRCKVQIAFIYLGRNDSDAYSSSV